MAKKIEMLNDQQEVVHPLTSSDCVIMENGKTLEEVMGDGIATPTVTHEGASFQVGVGDSNIEVVDGDVAGMTLEGQTYQNILPKPTTLIIETDEKEFKINDKIDNNIVLDDNIAEIATVKGQTYVNVVQEESATEYTVLGEELSGQSITTTGKPEGVIKNATLEGMTLVNTIQEPSEANSVVLDLDADINAQSATIDNTVQGGIKSAILTGQTLVNLKYRETAINNSKKFVVVENLIENKQYIAIFPYITNAKYAVYNMTTNKFIIGYNSSNKLIFTSPSSPDEVRLYVAFDDTTMELPSNALDIVCVEYQQGMENWDIPYFEGMQSVEAPSVKTTGKNLVELTSLRPQAGVSIIEINNAISWKISQWSDWHLYSQEIYVGKGTIFTVGATSYVSANINVINKDTDEIIANLRNNNKIETIVSPSDYVYLDFRADVEQKEANISEPRLNIGNSLLSYEPYQSSTLTTPSDVVLRKIGDVQDELDLETGKLTQRVGEVVLDGSEDWIKFRTNNGITLYYRYYDNMVGENWRNAILCDNMKTVLIGEVQPSNTWENNTITSIGAYFQSNKHGLGIYTSIGTATELKTYLASNPLTVQYKLATPITRQVDLSIVDQSNKSLKTIQAHPTLTHVSTSSQGLIPNIVIPSQLKYPTIIKPSTTYTVQLKHTTVNNDNPLTINLGGTTMAVPSTKFTIATPSALTSQDVIFTGKNNVIGEVVITEGDTTGIEYDFFKGMNDVTFGRVLTTGRNLIYVSKGLLTTNIYNGLTVTRDEMKQTITINGTCTTDNTSFGLAPFNMLMKNGKRYIISAELISGTSGKIVFRVNASDWSSNISCSCESWNNYKNSVAMTFTRDRLYDSSSCRVDSGETFVNATYRVMLEEKLQGSASSYEPYKGVTIEQSIDSIPLASSMFEQGRFNDAIFIKGMSLQQLAKEDSTIRIRSSKLIPVKPNAKYIINVPSNSLLGAGIAYSFDKNGAYNGKLSSFTSFTTKSDTYFIAGMFGNTDSSTITPSSLDSLNLTLQEVTDEIVLRSLPNGVKDTLNLTTGEYVQRVGEVVLDGSESWNKDTTSGGTKDNTAIFHTETNFNGFKPSPNVDYRDTMMLCDKIPIKARVYNLDEEGMMINQDGRIYIRINQSRLETVDMNGFKKFLLGNNVKVECELATPIIKKVNLTNTTKLPSYASTTHYDTIVPSNSLVPNIKIPSTVDYNVAIKPSTQYTIRANTTSAMSVNLGGSTGTLSNGKVTLTTPSTLAHNSLKLGNGKAKEVMVIEGSEIKDNVPFFNGMKNVQMGGIKLVNIARFESNPNSSVVSMNANKTVYTYVADGSTYWGKVVFDDTLLKPNTMYTVFANITENTSTVAKPFGFSIGDNNKPSMIYLSGTGLVKQTITSSEIIKDGFFYMAFRPTTSGEKIVIQNPMVIEGDWTHLDEIPFIESEMIIEQPIIRSQGKNLFDVYNMSSKNGWHCDKTITNDGKIKLVVNNTDGVAFWQTDEIPVEVGKTYYINISKEGMTSYCTLWANGDKSKQYTNPITITPDIKTISLGLYMNNSAIGNEGTWQIQVEEGSSATTYEPFKQHTLSSNRVIGYEENCFYGGTDGTKITTAYFNSVMADVEGLSIAYVTNGSTNFSFWDKDMVFISGKSYLDTSLSSDDKNGFIKVPSNAKYMKFASANTTGSTTDYTKATVTGELPLRSLPNGVCDSFNLVTGEYVQRVGEVILNGSETDWLLSASTVNLSGQKTISFQRPFSGIKYTGINGSIILKSDKLSCLPLAETLQDLQVDMECIKSYSSTSTNVGIRILKSRLLTQDTTGFKQYLSQNPITVQYELATPIVRKIGLTAKGNYKEQVLDGSETWAMDTIDNNKTVRMTKKTTSPLQDPLFNTVLFTNDYHVRARGDNHGTYEYITCIGTGIYINIYQSKVKELSVQGCTQWLSQNPIKVGYITSTQSSESYSNIHKPIFFNNVNVQFLPHNLDIQPTLTLQSRSRNSYVMDMMKANTRYTLKALKNSNSFTIDGASYGATTNGTFTSPSTLTNKLLITGQDVQELMIIEGDVTGKQLPYYKGIRSSFDNTDEIEIYSANKNLLPKEFSNRCFGENVKQITRICSKMVECKPNTAYTVYNIPSDVYTDVYVEYANDYAEFDETVTTSRISIASYGKRSRITFTTPFGYKYMAIYIFSGSGFSEDGYSYKNAKISLCLGTLDDYTYQQHQHNTTSLPMPTRLETVEVVKIDMLKDIELGAINPSGVNADSANRKRSIGYIPVQPNQKIVANRSINIFMYDINKNFIKYKASSDNTFAPDNCYFIRFYCDIANTNNITITKQAYKPIALNSLPNGIKDEIIIEPVSNKAKLIQRVGKVVLDGSESWSIHTKWSAGNILCSSVTVHNKKAGGFACCDKFESILAKDAMDTGSVNTGKAIKEGIRYDASSSVIYLFVSKDRLGQGVEEYLKQNPITVYYELAEPVVTEIQLKGYPFVYKDGSVQLNTEIPHTTKVKYNVNQEHLINGQNETIIRHDKQIDNLYDYIELYLEEEYRMELFRMQLELSL